MLAFVIKKTWNHQIATKEYSLFHLFFLMFFKVN